MANPQNHPPLVSPLPRPCAPRDPSRASRNPYPITRQDGSVVLRTLQHGTSTPSSAPSPSRSTFRFPIGIEQPEMAMTTITTTTGRKATKKARCGGITRHSRRAPRRTSGARWARCFPQTPRKIHRQWQATIRVVLAAGGGHKCFRGSPVRGCGRRGWKVRLGLGRLVVGWAVSRVGWR